jgi:NAD(P)-dependent dehydrogenase (short-subunit alcohol dehydrogenase family)
MQRAIVVGASSGVGAELSRRLTARGLQVVLIAPPHEPADDLAQELTDLHGPLAARSVQHDVREAQAVDELFQELVKDLGSLDLLVYVAGIQPEVALDEFNNEKDLAVIDIDLRGGVAWLNAAAAYFQERRAGTLAAISSVAGDCGRKPYPAYHAAKGGLSIFMESLWLRLSGMGIGVVTIKPGPLATRLTEGRTDIPTPYPLDKAVDLILAAIDKKKRVAYVPGKWYLIMKILVHVPAVLFRRLPI